MDGFWLGPIKIYYYSLCLLAAVWIAYGLVLRQASRHRIASVVVENSVIIVLISGIIGARLGYGLQNLPYFSTHPSAWLQLSTGGLSIHGAVIVGGLALYAYTQRQKLAWLQMTDILARPLLAGQIIGRLGNYFNQELFGYPTQLPWKIFIDIAHRPADYRGFSYFHPTFAYEMIGNGIGLLIMSRIANKKNGLQTGLYLLVFSLSRFLTEFWRISDRVLGSLSLAQLFSLAGLIVGIVLVLQTLGTRHNVFEK